MENEKFDILAPSEAWDEADRQIDYDREDQAGWNGRRFRRLS